MNVRQVMFVVIAAIAALAIALLVRAALVGGAPKVPVVVTDHSVRAVLVAARDIAPGEVIGPGMVTWQVWPRSSIAQAFITGNTQTPPESVVVGTVALSPMVSGEPLTWTKILKSDVSGLMAAKLAPGMRAVAIPVSVTTAVAGFVQPNSRVDLLLTRNADGKVVADVVQADVRVLAVDQVTDARPAGQPSVADARTVTLELSPDQVKTVARAQVMGTLSLALRPIAGQAMANAHGHIRIVRGSMEPVRAGGE